MVYISTLKIDLSGPKSVEALEYKPLETYLLNFLVGLLQLKEGATITISILGKNV